MENIPVVGGVSTVFSGLATAVQANEILQWVGLAITILCGLSTLAEIIYNWYRKSKEDGKITKDELQELYNDLKDKYDDLKNKKEK